MNDKLRQHIAESLAHAYLRWASAQVERDRVPARLSDFDIDMQRNLLDDVLDAMVASRSILYRPLVLDKELTELVQQAVQHGTACVRHGMYPLVKRSLEARKG